MYVPLNIPFLFVFLLQCNISVHGYILLIDTFPFSVQIFTAALQLSLDDLSAWVRQFASFDLPDVDFEHLFGLAPSRTFIPTSLKPYPSPITFFDRHLGGSYSQESH
ncbi:hypothetical protein IW262DRAFT_1489627, partial [Armillaria fumosa]